jgi:indole-3-glycerol phosphate synthase
MGESILNKIKNYKLKEIVAQKKKIDFKTLEAQAKSAIATRGFISSLVSQKNNKSFKVICEIKRASPSKGLIRKDFDVEKLAFAYSRGGATCLSVLTDGPSFGGKLDYVTIARNSTKLPILRKDFMYDPYQVHQARVIGADCILIIMAAVSDTQANELEASASELGMDVLIEIHNELELSRALDLKSQLIGINNRDLNTFKVDISTTERLSKLIPNEKTIISESGLKCSKDLDRLSKCGAKGFLVGETLMRQKNVEKATKELILKDEQY